ncbi:hypothetical protein ZWY2020_053568 [Hordeum vulgare]|nr:hypothetical protein ZWY2020_053568 [Hordeum vulgare]
MRSIPWRRFGAASPAPPSVPSSLSSIILALPLPLQSNSLGTSLFNNASQRCLRRSCRHCVGESHNPRFSVVVAGLVRLPRLPSRSTLVEHHRELKKTCFGESKLLIAIQMMLSKGKQRSRNSELHLGLCPPVERNIVMKHAWRPEDIRWPDVSVEAETGKIYRAPFTDREGRTVIVMRPAKQNTSSHEGQLQYLTYTLENAVLNLPQGQDKMVWLIDFTGWTLAHRSPFKTSRESMNTVQNHYPERLAVAFMFNPPKVFEASFKVLKVLIDPKSAQKLNFVYKENEESMKTMYSHIDPEVLPVEFGGKNNVLYNHEDYSKLMTKDDIKTSSFWGADGSGPRIPQWHARLEERIEDGVADTATGGGMDGVVEEGVDDPAPVSASGGHGGTTTDGEGAASESGHVGEAEDGQGVALEGCQGPPKQDSDDGAAASYASTPAWLEG